MSDNDKRKRDELGLSPLQRQYFDSIKSFCVGGVDEYFSTAKGEKAPTIEEAIAEIKKMNATELRQALKEE